MTLQQIQAQIAKLGVYKQQQIEAYQSLKTDLYKKVREQTMYQSEADLRLSNFRKEAEAYSTTEYNSIKNKLSAFEQSEKEKIKAEYETVTADDVAELTLLGTMAVNEGEIKGYLERYKKNPLAVKKIHEIATENKIELPQYILKEDRLSNTIETLKQYAGYYQAAEIADNLGSASDLAFTLVVADEGMNQAVDSYVVTAP
ncbi:hypothetical protein [Streptococcus himalayensis]|uniref:Uncharacterized protein n=1 Tax=Streptococcus himalayensis TaxID=1888195 RepID=A0A917A8R7_9STRE|nr:hypothetical protein [Streptococcus himalayensis]QBX08391.1 hypothetical protein JavanS257_0001 [Streptococcus satellite phage Javan257]GGE34674.1 hypothetical protein GCM10011510_15000 [Streptococcus himalayensis]